MAQREENEDPRDGLPSLPGTYVLVLRFSKRLEIVGRQTWGAFGAGGLLRVRRQRLGPGGLAARVGRHCRREKTLRWHVDYLRADGADRRSVVRDRKESPGVPVGQRIMYAAGGVRASGGIRGVGLRLPSHLCFFNLPPSLADFRKQLRNRRIERLRIADAKGVRTLLLRLLDGRRLVELGGKLFADPLAEGLLDEPAGIAATRSGEASGLHAWFRPWR